LVIHGLRAASSAEISLLCADVPGGFGIAHAGSAFSTISVPVPLDIVILCPRMTECPLEFVSGSENIQLSHRSSRSITAPMPLFARTGTKLASIRIDSRQFASIRVRLAFSVPSRDNRKGAIRLRRADHLQACDWVTLTRA
jgi:hypothetical protein